MENILKKLPLSEVIKMTLMGKKSSMSDYLNLAASYQMADWDSVAQHAKYLGLSQEKLPQVYFDALGWADSVFSANQ
jgi:c-di-GMP-related signal transduction protein